MRPHGNRKGQGRGITIPKTDKARPNDGTNDHYRDSWGPRRSINHRYRTGEGGYVRTIPATAEEAEDFDQHANKVAPIQARSQSEYKRLKAQGAEVAPPHGFKCLGSDGTTICAERNHPCDVCRVSFREHPIRVSPVSSGSEGGAE